MLDNVFVESFFRLFIFCLFKRLRFIGMNPDEAFQPLVSIMFMDARGHSLKPELALELEVDERLGILG